MSFRGWVLLNFSPLWIEESGLPELLFRGNEPGAWDLFKRLVEADCARNLLPDWFSVGREELVRWTGIPLDRISRVIALLKGEGLIEVQEFGESFRVRIERPLPVPVGKKTLLHRLRSRGIVADTIRLRYAEAGAEDERFQRVLELYQSVYGARINPQIVDDLRELAATFEWSAIEETFAEARRRKDYTLHGILHHLYKEAYDESLSENIRDPHKDPLPSGYEFT